MDFLKHGEDLSALIGSRYSEFEIREHWMKISGYTNNVDNFNISCLWISSTLKWESKTEPEIFGATISFHKAFAASCLGSCLS